ncbi:hypothetical protein FPQ18DRAFT_413320 [Pyronema domesticum]|nr:hypothetical protein FPQ18DRAFT_413320 [Pyronema domesticum]
MRRVVLIYLLYLDGIISTDTSNRPYKLHTRRHGQPWTSNRDRNPDQRSLFEEQASSCYDHRCIAPTQRQRCQLTEVEEYVLCHQGGPACRCGSRAFVGT